MTRDNPLKDKRIHVNLVKLKKAGEHFEIVVDPDLAIAYKKTGKGDVHDILKAEWVFTDASQGVKAPEHILMEIFGTSEALEIAPIMIKEGEIQMTAPHREQLREAKRKLAMAIIHRNGIDPRTNAPHPMTRIENAFVEAKITMDEFRTADEQIQDILRKLSPVLPIRFSVKDIELHVPANYAHKIYGILKTFGTVQKSDWASDGSLRAVIEIPGGLEQEFYDKINSLTQGHVSCQVLKVK